MNDSCPNENGKGRPDELEAALAGAILIRGPFLDCATNCAVMPARIAAKLRSLHPIDELTTILVLDEDTPPPIELMDRPLAIRMDKVAREIALWECAIFCGHYYDAPSDTLLLLGRRMLEDVQQSGALDGNWRRGNAPEEGSDQ